MTVRRSRDRLSLKPDIPPCTPDNVLKRRSLDRPQDKNYSTENDLVFRGTSAITYRRNHGEVMQGPNRVIPYSQDDPDEGFRYVGKKNRLHDPKPEPKTPDAPRDPLLRLPGEESSEDGDYSDDDSDEDE